MKKKRKLVKRARAAKPVALAPKTDNTPSGKRRAAREAAEKWAAEQVAKFHGIRQNGHASPIERAILDQLKLHPERYGALEELRGRIAVLAVPDGLRWRIVAATKAWLKADRERADIWKELNQIGVGGTYYTTDALSEFYEWVMAEAQK